MPGRPSAVPGDGEKMGIFVLESGFQPFHIGDDHLAQDDRFGMVVGDAGANPQILPNQLRNVAHRVMAAELGV